MNEYEIDAASRVVGQKIERSPSFPYINLTKALERARQVYQFAKRFEARPIDVAASWGLGLKSSGTQQTIAALVAYGLLESSGLGDARKLKISDIAFKALEDNRPGQRDLALSQAAIRPKLIAEYASIWGKSRPADAMCISELRIERNFTPDGAKVFLKVYDDAVKYMTEMGNDSGVDENTIFNEAEDNDEASLNEVVLYAQPQAPKSGAGSDKPHTSEREIMSGLLSKQTSFRLLVSGPIGEKEISQLIRKLELDKEILAEDMAQ